MFLLIALVGGAAGGFIVGCLAMWVSYVVGPSNRSKGDKENFGGFLIFFFTPLGVLLLFLVRYAF
jgi:hypothetical protein